ncbi:hypothetical protein [Amycolatopsis sp. cg9]|uniref:hypothetical protein n=1 Tax=Amycolatopsis sp. cg9 TaxID=3238801 RepID=UPI003524880E
MRGKIGVVAGVALAALVTGVTDAGAAAGTGFTAQARAAGLSAGQAGELQAEVDRGLDTLGGVQVAANEITTADGATVRYALPGEKYVHKLGDGLDGNAATTAAESCPYYNFCGYRGANYTGAQWFKSNCGTYNEIPDGWNSGGSWINNQSHHFTSSMFNKKKYHVFTTKPARSYDPNGNWGPVWYVMNNC